ncbi:MAG: hypothetical protein IT530_02380 [Burkholderiales bacterium]|nr:hypothetical protein [Burkholderiales bacterium]
MVERGTDQADGLRRMFGGVRTRVLELASGIAGVGRTAVAVNLAAALARSGRNTLLVDFVADSAASRAYRYLGVQPGADRGPLPAGKGCGVIALSHREWLQTGPLPASALGSGIAMRRETALYDWVLVNGAGIEPPIASDDGSRDVLVVLSSDVRSITEAYALVKRTAAADRRCRYRVLVNRVHSAAAAQRIFRNMADVAGGYLGVQLAQIGFVPADPAVERAAAAGVSVFEHAPAALAARAFARLADAIANPVGDRPQYASPPMNTAVAAGAM